MRELVKLQIVYDTLKYGSESDPRMVRNIESDERSEIYKFIGNLILARSSELVPVKTGRLRDSGKVVRNSIGTYSVVYDCDYAVFVHEIVDYHHDFPTQSKFLEDAAWYVLNQFQSYLPFTFSLDTGYDEKLALHLDSLSVEDFKSNISKMTSNQVIIQRMVQSMIAGSVDLSGLDDLDNDYIQVKERITYDLS